MNTINSTINNNEKNVDTYFPADKCIKIPPTHFCEVMINSKTSLFPPPKINTKLYQFVDVEAKIEKICTGKIIIGGTIHKTIIYKAIENNNFTWEYSRKNTDIPFSCFINIDPCDSCDMYEIIHCKSICSFSEIININDQCSNKSILVEKDIVKIVVDKITCCNIKKQKFCSKTVLDNEICFLPPVNPCAASVSVNIDKANFKVELVCCDLIVVCGFITKTVAFTDDTPTVNKDILVQINIPANIYDLDDLCPKKWTVTCVEVCASCFDFTCPSTDGDLYHKLALKDIISVQVTHK